MTETRAHLDGTAAATLVVLCLCWGLQQVSIKIAIEGIPPILQGGMRSAGSLLLLWGWAVWQRTPLFRRDGSLGWGVLAGSLFGAEFLLIFLGLTYTTASRGVLFLYTCPFMVALGAHFLIPGERLRTIQVVGLLCAFAGMIVAFADALRLPTRQELIGDVMILVAAVLWAATTLVIKASPLIRLSATKVLFYQLGVSAVLLPLASVLFGEGGVTGLGPMILGALGFQIVIVAFASYLAWFWLVSRYPVGRLTAFSFLTPLFGVLAGGLLLGERISGALVLALLLVCAGIYLVNRHPARGAAPAGLSKGAGKA